MQPPIDSQPFQGPRSLLGRFGWCCLPLLLMLSCYQNSVLGLSTPVVIKVSPGSLDTIPGREVAFTATQSKAGALLWSVEPASLGTIDASGRFKAGSSPGQGLVRARWAPGPEFSGTAAVTILAPPLAAQTSPDLCEASGAIQTSVNGASRNHAVVSEDVEPRTASTPDGTLVLHHGYRIQPATAGP